MRIGPYEILRELGRGAMGVVYLAEDERIHRRVAIKTIQIDAGLPKEDREQLFARFQREVRASGSLMHPNIAIVYSAGEHEGVPYLAMEFVDGQPMEALVRSPDPWDGPSVGGLLQIARGLDYAHGSGIVHRDIKPGNIMVAKNGAFKIVDFGIAKVIADAQSSLTSGAVGTPNYMSPEQISGTPIDGRSDQFALAVIAYRILTGRMPFKGESPAVLCFQIVHMEPEKPSTANPRWSPEVDAVINRALAKDPVWRYRTCEEFITTLTAAMQQQPKPLPPPPPVPADPFATRPMIWIAAGLLLLVTLGAFLVWAKNRYLNSLQTHQSSPFVPEIVKSPPIDPVVIAPLKPDRAGKDDPAKQVESDLPPGVQTPRPIQLNNKDQLRYAWLPPATFAMGCVKPECEADEFRRHSVTLTHGFWIGQTEATVGAYKLFTKSTGRQMPEANGAWADWSDDHQPMGNVTWDEARAFCAWSGGRLPTEAEWEYAGRAGAKGGTYGALAQIAWYYNNSAPYAAAHEHQAPRVALKQPNAFSLYDMLGSVREWTADYFSETYYSKSPAEDPRGPTSGDRRVFRGGAWLNNDYDLKLWNRAGSEPDYRSSDLGFRCANISLGTP